MKISGWCFVVWLLWSFTAEAELRLGFLPDEPAPSVARTVASTASGHGSLQLIPYESADQLRDGLLRAEIDAALLEEPAAPVEGLSLVTDVYPSVLHILQAESGQLTQLDGLLRSGSVYAGAPGSAGTRLVAALSADYLLEPDEVRLIPSALATDPDVYFIFGGLLAADAVRRLQDFRLFSLGSPERLMQGSVAESLMLRYPNLRPFILPANLYPSLSREAVLTVAVSTLLVVRNDLPDEQVYQLAALVDRARPMISAVYPLAALPLVTSDQRQARTLPLAGGARRYRDRDEPGVLERYAEVMALGTSLFIAVGSGLVAFDRRRRRTRKDRLDGFFRSVIDARPAIGADTEQRAAARSQICRSQAEVLEMVIAERIEADSALVAFLTLSNQVLVEAERA